MNQKEREKILDTLLSSLSNWTGNAFKYNGSEPYSEKRKKLRAYMNVFHSSDIPQEFFDLQDMFLSDETESKALVGVCGLKTVKKDFDNTLPFSDRMSLWRGDITTIKSDAIVNAANSKMLGCFVPLHNCIDNVIHSAAGMQLRAECNRQMMVQGHDEETGKAKITPAYNLPSKYVIHTVGPIISEKVGKKQIDLLRSSYQSCLEITKDHEDIESITFCCISTGVFRFPKELAAKIAVSTVIKWFEQNPESPLKRVVFNVFTKEDEDIYEQLFRSDEADLHLN